MLTLSIYIIRLPQSFSSDLSSQSGCPSQVQLLGIQFPSRWHWNISPGHLSSTPSISQWDQWRCGSANSLHSCSHSSRPSVQSCSPSHCQTTGIQIPSVHLKSPLSQVVISEEQFLSSDPSPQSSSPSQSQRSGTHRPLEHLSWDFSQLRATSAGGASLLSRSSRYRII